MEGVYVHTHTHTYIFDIPTGIWKMSDFKIHVDNLDDNPRNRVITVSFCRENVGIGKLGDVRSVLDNITNGDLHVCYVVINCTEGYTVCPVLMNEIHDLLRSNRRPAWAVYIVILSNINAIPAFHIRYLDGILGDIKTNTRAILHASPGEILTIRFFYERALR